MDGKRQYKNEVESNELLGDRNLKYIDEPNDSKAINDADASYKLHSLEKETEVNESEEVKMSDINVDEDSRSFKKYKLRQAPKFKVQNLNENKLLQFSQSIQNGDREIKAQESTKEVIFKTKQNKTKAVIKSQENEKNVYECMCCKTFFEKGIDLVKHKEEHKNECYACEKCNISFSSQIIYLNHTYKHTKPPYSCRECLFKTKGLKSIKAHIQRHSTKKLECGICKNEFYFCEIGVHKQSHNSTKYECGECGAIKENKATFEYHMISHAGVKKYQCLYCGKGYAHPSHLRVHTQVHTSDPNAHECDECGKKYKCANSLWHHKAGSHSKKLYECDYCGRKLKSKISIEQHLLLHTGYKAFKCPECPLSFHTKTHLRLHTYSKHIEDRFKCELCSRSFSMNSDYKRHLRSNMHKNNVFKKEKLAKK